MLNVTNREYYVRVKLPIQQPEDFHAVVNANLFLRLVSQLTSETIELTVDNNSLIVKAKTLVSLP